MLILIYIFLMGCIQTGSLIGVLNLALQNYSWDENHVLLVIRNDWVIILSVMV